MSDQTGVLGGRLPRADPTDLNPDYEVIIAGPNVTRGYLGCPDGTARVIVDGWLHTGDNAHLGSDGYLTLLGSGGRRHWPARRQMGETVAAYVTPRHAHTINIDTLHALCAAKLAA